MWIRKNVQDAAGLEKIWWNYWDTCITYERSYYTRLNYPDLFINIHFPEKEAGKRRDSGYA
jgi:hypothetical protein